MTVDALTLSVAWQLAKDGGYSCPEDAVEEAERLLELEGEPLQPTPLEVLRQPVHNQAEIDALAVAVLMGG